MQSPFTTPTKRTQPHVANTDIFGGASTTRSPRSIFQPLAPANSKTDITRNALPPLPPKRPSTPVDAEERPTKRRRLSPPGTAEADPAAVSSFSSANAASGTSSSNNKSSYQSKHLTPLSGPSLYSGRNCYVYTCAPPTAVELVESTEQVGIPSKIYRDPYYSEKSDAPERPREYAGLVFHLKGGDGVANLEVWKEDESAPSMVTGHRAQEFDATGVSGWEYASTPPSAKQAQKWLKEQASRPNERSTRTKDSSQVLHNLPFRFIDITKPRPTD